MGKCTQLSGRCLFVYLLTNRPTHIGLYVCQYTFVGKYACTPYCRLVFILSPWRGERKARISSIISSRDHSVVRLASILTMFYVKCMLSQSPGTRVCEKKKATSEVSALFLRALIHIVVVGYPKKHNSEANSDLFLWEAPESNSDKSDYS